MGKITTSINTGENKDRKGLLGYYYKEIDFNDLILFGPTHNESLMYNQNDVDKLVKKENQNFASARWIGYIKSNETGNFKLKMSDDKNTVIAINGQVVSNFGQDKKEVSLKEREPVFIEIAYNNSKEKIITNFELIKANGDKEIKVTREELLTPDNDVNKSHTFIEKSKKIAEVTAFSVSNLGRNLIDSDGDGIPDELEINGYTVRNNTAVPWKNEYALEGYVKYVSNPYRAYTSGDPYTDYEKAFGKIPGSNSKETRNPVVAAYPSVGVSTEKFILSQDKTMSNQATSNESHSTSNANTVGVSVTAEISGSPTGFGWKTGVTASFSNTKTKSDTWGTSTTNTEQFNTAKAGYLNANIRYKNTGSGAIYDVKPTTSFVLNGDTLHTITANLNTQALSIPAGNSYPNIDQAPIALTTTNGSNPISLDIDQLKKILDNTPLITNTNQVDGHYGIINSNGQVEIGGRWTVVQDEIDARTATIIFDNGDGEILERRVAAKDYTDPEDRTPILTLKEALVSSDKKFEDTEQGLYFRYEKKGKNVRKKVNELSSIVVGDTYTIDEIKKQIEDKTGTFRDVNSVMDVKITPKMKIAINLAKAFDSGDLQQPIFIAQGNGFSRLDGGNVTEPHLKGDGQYRGFRHPTGFPEFVFYGNYYSLIPGKKYVLKMYLKMQNKNITENRIGTRNNYGTIKSIYVDLSKDEFKEVSMEIDTTINYIIFYFVDNDSFYLDDIAIFEK